jgi:hypothetical protein
MQLEEQLVREYFGDPKGEHTEKEIMKTERMMNTWSGIKILQIGTG